MLAWIRERSSWLLVATLVALLVTLGVMQTRWISALGRAQSERLRGDMQRSGQRFAGELERELGRVFFAFLLEPGGELETREARYAERLREWRTTAHRAGLVSGLALALRRPTGEFAYLALDEASSRFTPAPWPAAFGELRGHLQHGFGPRSPGVDMLVQEPFSLLVPSLGAPDDDPPRPPSEQRRAWHVGGVAIVLLSRAYVIEELLPELAEAHFGPPAESEFIVAVAQREPAQLLFASDPSFTRGEPGDVRVPLASLRRPGGRRLHGLGPLHEHAPGGPPPRGAPAWELLLRHRSGSLEDAAAAYRHRNLAYSAGMLALIGVAATLLALGDRRARRLARQQLEFVAGVTHELHTPLTAIRSAGQNLKDGVVTAPEQVRRYGGLIEHEGGRLTALIGQVLEFAGIQSGSRTYASEPVALEPLVRGAVQDFALVLEQAGLKADVRVAPDLPELRGDAAALRGALGNLLANAAKFAASGGDVTVAAERQGDAVELRVLDRGPGIPAAERERVLEPFYRGQAAQSGSVPGNGLGLSLVRHVALAHGGSVRVEGREGGGTRVVLRLPLP